MSSETLDPTLRLPSLVIKNFRGIDAMTLPRLGRVTLLAGKNGMGKTTVLDAVRVYAARARARILSEVLLGRDEIVNEIDEDGDEFSTPDWSALFSGRFTSPDQAVAIGPSLDSDELQIRMVALTGEDISQLELFQSGIFADEEMLGLGNKVPKRSIHSPDKPFTAFWSVRNARLDSAKSSPFVGISRIPA